MITKRTLAMALLASVLTLSAAYAASATSIGTDISTANLTVSGYVKSDDFVDSAGNSTLGFVPTGADSSFFMQNNTLGNNPVFGVWAANANQGLTLQLKGDSTFRFTGTTAGLDTFEIKPSHSASGATNAGLLSMKGDLTASREWNLQNASGVIPLGSVGNDLFFTTAANTTLTLPASGTLATLAGSETLSNKTLDKPVIAAWEGIYTSAGATAPAVAVYGMPANTNYIEIGSGASGGPAGIAVQTKSVAPTDDNVGLQLGLRGTGALMIQSTAANADKLFIAPATGGGASFAGKLTSADITGSDKTWSLPNTSGTLSLDGHAHAGYAVSGANNDITALQAMNQMDVNSALYIGTGAVGNTQNLFLGRTGYATFLNGVGLYFSDDQTDRILSVSTNNANPAETLVISGQAGDGTATDGGKVRIMGGGNGGGGTGAPGYVYFGDGSAAVVNMSSPDVDDVYMEGRLEVDGDALLNRVGIGLTNPTSPLHLQTTDSSTTAGNYRGAYLYVTDDGIVSSGGDNTHGMKIMAYRSNHTGTVSANLFGLQADANFSTDGGAGATETAYGVFATAQGGDTVYGVYATGNANTTAANVYGVSAEASNAGSTNYALYGNAGGGPVNWAGYFAGGNVYVQNSLGIGDDTPVATFTVGSGDKFQVDGTTGNVTTQGNIISSLQGVTAAGADQASATPLAKDINIVTGGAGGVRLPTAVAGMQIKVLNRSSADINLYPESGGLINALGINSPKTVVNNNTAWCTAMNSTTWDCVTLVW